MTGLLLDKKLQIGPHHLCDKNKEKKKKKNAYIFIAVTLKEQNKNNKDQIYILSTSACPGRILFSLQ